MAKAIEITSQTVHLIDRSSLLGRLSEAPHAIYGFAMSRRSALTGEMRAADRRKRARLEAEDRMLLRVIRRFYARHEGGTGIAGYCEETGRRT